MIFFCRLVRDHLRRGTTVSSSTKVWQCCLVNIFFCVLEVQLKKYFPLEAESSNFDYVVEGNLQ